MTIKFGTSSWRAVIADDFTFAGVRNVTSAICSHFESRNSTGNLMVLGSDTRFLGEKFAEECAHVISANAFRALLCDAPIPTPPVGFKYIGELINEDKIVIGGEESAGLSIKGHYPEKDGILACLLAAKADAARGKSLTEQLEESYATSWKTGGGRHRCKAYS